MARRPRDSSTPVDAPPASRLRTEELGPPEQDEVIAKDGIPQGWRSCPCFGQQPIMIMNSKLIPMKVPLDQRYDDRIAPGDRFYPEQALEECSRFNWHPGLVIDLTYTNRYYDAGIWDGRVSYLKIRCRGRGEAPQEEDVNTFMWHLLSWAHECLTQQFTYPDVIVHCTHGFNRTGYMICSALIRIEQLTVSKALRIFSDCRPPGIYKDDYIQKMFKYYHEIRPKQLQAPGTPEWKGPSGSPPREQQPTPDSPANEDMHHDDVIGEPIDAAEVHQVQLLIMEKLLGREWDGRRIFFPGSQPVSLAASNLELLKRRRYWVTWKADGTRYMMLLCKWGCYIIDRKFDVRRLQMRFPTRVPSEERKKSKRLVGPMHHNTLLDGEMVVDEDAETGIKSRRFLVYDLMVLRDQPVTHRPFKERFDMIEREVMEPRNMERAYIQSGKYTYPYDYSTESFKVRRKDFWPLVHSGKIIHTFIPTLSHESDGLILQGYEDEYKPLTCEELLKWKFAHLNSVDFKLRNDNEGGLELCVMQPRGRNRGTDIVPLPEAQVRFPEGVSAEDYIDKIIECSYDGTTDEWVFMRERTDKDLPNARRVYEKVVQSILDNITEDVLLHHIQDALQEPFYSKDVRAAAGAQDHL